jgi:hypothetical protein
MVLYFDRTCGRGVGDNWVPAFCAGILVLRVLRVIVVPSAYTQMTYYYYFVPQKAFWQMF